MARQVAGVTRSAAPEAGRGVTARKVVAVLAVVLAAAAIRGLAGPAGTLLVAVMFIVVLCPPRAGSAPTCCRSTGGTSG